MNKLCANCKLLYLIVVTLQCFFFLNSFANFFRCFHWPLFFRPGFYGEIGGSPARPSGPPPQRMMGPRQQGPPLRGGPPLLNHPNPRMPPMGHPNRPPLPRPRMGSFPPGMRPNMMPHGMGPPPQGNMPPRMPPNMGHQDSPMPPQQGLLGPHPGPMGPGPGNFRPQAPQSPFESTEVESEGNAFKYWNCAKN